MYRLSRADFDPDESDEPVIALRIDVQEHQRELPTHHHRKGQLVLALRGVVTCEMSNGVWIVPPNSAVWIPSWVPHSNRVSVNGRICLLFVAPEVGALAPECCTLAITPLVREMILHLAQCPPDYGRDGSMERFIAVLLDELSRMPVEKLHLPIADDERLRRIATALMADPSDRSTIAQWAARVAMSERTLARHVLQATGMTFGQWRQQLLVIVAMQRLSAGDSVQAVAGDLGYESVSAFITMFRKKLGKSPGQYFGPKPRQQH